jgi:hypothetical protein
LADPAVSVVIGATASDEALVACLQALEPQRDGVEVLVVGSRAASQSVADRFPWAELHEVEGALVPVLWSHGIERSRGEIVALTIAQMVPEPDWLEAIKREHAAHDAVGGAIDPGPDLRLADWAEYFCRYAREMRPFAPTEDGEPAGDNVSFKRSLLERHAGALRDGYWEVVLHPVLRRAGVDLWRTPAVGLSLGRSNGFAAFVRQRAAHGRLYGHQRGADFSRPRALAGIATAPLVPGLMTAKLLREVLQKKRNRLRALLALPYVVAFNGVWAYAEARGYVDLLRR